jgi:hypothetical protein
MKAFTGSQAVNYVRRDDREPEEATQSGRPSYRLACDARQKLMNNFTEKVSANDIFDRPRALSWKKPSRSWSSVPLRSAHPSISWRLPAGRRIEPLTHGRISMRPYKTPGLCSSGWGGHQFNHSIRQAFDPSIP